ncbi:hypothetical protein [uncultured Bacteroides sp.]|uniref:hypothetical protein n=1 Tax=uncultured Bacteroides sp. TaxID=162156 RepID=UPI002AAAC314|nr:hypothetical protein [uncultured Bacteroides sp.]
MKRIIFSLVILISFLTGNAQNPFARYGYKVKVSTMSNGKYDEFHDKDRVVEIGSVRFDTRMNKILGTVEKDSTIAQVSPHVVSRFVSIDPHAEKYYSISPYVYCNDNPIKFVDPNGKDIAILIAKEGAGGRGHMGAVIQSGNGRYYYITAGPKDETAERVAATSSGLSNGVPGGMHIYPIGEFKNMSEAISCVGKIDTSNKPYTESLILKTSSKMDADVHKSAMNEQESLIAGDEKYNAITNNCADIVETVIKNGTGVDLPSGLSPKPNAKFDNIKEKKEDVQFEINKKRANEM